MSAFALMFFGERGQPLRIIKRSIHQGGESEVLNKIFRAPKNKRRQRNDHEA
jgi:hypothetical protein